MVVSLRSALVSCALFSCAFSNPGVVHLNADGSVADAAGPIILDGSVTAWTYDGHGALSAGASSRLLIDYDEPYRSDILDLLFKPNYGAAMHMIKVEIGGDGQSTDGTEPSHMHYRDDLSCDRGYEFWLLEEARKRNPKIQTWALSWASPWWVGNQTGYYSDDEIDYHVKWLNCTKQYDIGTIDYMGNWNERPWGNADWTKRFKKAMEDAGFADTQLILPDGNSFKSIEQAMDGDPIFKTAVAGIGLHYPCNRPAPEVQQQYGKKFWSAEDYSTVGNWDGAACWGRLLNQNYVRMNMTSTTSWSLIWSVYGEGFPYFGNGLMYAMTPWSGYYEYGQEGTDNGAAIWTNAHTCQFVEVGWKYLAVGAGAGDLAGGGSYVTLVDPTATHFTLVLEKLEGRCLRCAGQKTSDETVKLVLGGGLEKMAKAAGKLQLWRTNLTHRFVNEGNITVAADNSIQVLVGKDSMVTVSSWFNGQTKMMPKVPANTDFPLPYSDAFDSYKADQGAKYFADNGGSFQIAAAPVLSSGSGGGRGMVVKQWVTNENGVNRWGNNVNPITLIGNASWADISVSVDVLLGPGPPPAPTPPPSPLSKYQHWQSKFNGECLDVKGKGTFDGAEVDTWSCVTATNEAFGYDSVSGHFVDENSKKCMSAVGCPDKGLCIQKCTGTGASAGMEWTVGADHTIRPRGTPASCLQVASKTLDAPLSLAPCSTPPTDEQLWLNSTSPPPLPSTLYAGTCVRTDRNGKGVCLQLSSSGDWVLTGTAAKGKVSKDPTKEWTTLGITAKGTAITAIIDGKPQPPTLALPIDRGNSVQYGVAAAAGMVSINSNYNVAYFDNFELKSA